MLLKNINSELKLFYIFLIITILFIKLLFIKFFPAITGDLETNIKVAKNILSGCGVSISNVNYEECLPHFGGNQGPVYPFIIASIFKIFGENIDYVRYFQGFFLTLCSIFFFITLEKIFFIDKKFKLFTFIIIISPISFPWVRFITADTISISFLFLYFSFFLISLKKEKIQILPLSILLGIGSHIRFDFIILGITLLIFFNIYEKKKQFFIDGLKMLVIGLIIWSPWTYRNIEKGVAIFPTHQQQQATHNSSEYYPKYFYKWISTWMTHEYERVGTIYHLSNKNFSKIKFDYNVAFSNEDEKKKIIELLEELSKFDNKNFPRHIDEKIKIITDEKISSDKINYYFFVPLKRVFHLLFNYKNSFGWPFEISKNLNEDMKKNNYNLSIKHMVEITLQNFVPILGKLVISIYRFSILIIFFWIILRKSNDKLIENIAVAILLYFIAKSCFHSFYNVAETRYTWPIFVLMEIVVFIKLLRLKIKIL